MSWAGNPFLCMCAINSIHLIVICLNSASNEEILVRISLMMKENIRIYWPSIQLSNQNKLCSTIKWTKVLHDYFHLQFLLPKSPLTCYFWYLQAWKSQLDTSINVLDHAPTATWWPLREPASTLSFTSPKQFLVCSTYKHWSISKRDQGQSTSVSRKFIIMYPWKLTEALPNNKKN